MGFQSIASGDGLDWVRRGAGLGEVSRRRGLNGEYVVLTVDGEGWIIGGRRGVTGLIG